MFTKLMRPAVMAVSMLVVPVAGAAGLHDDLHEATRAIADAKGGTAFECASVPDTYVQRSGPYGGTATIRYNECKDVTQTANSIEVIYHAQLANYSPYPGYYDSGNVKVIYRYVINNDGTQTVSYITDAATNALTGGDTAVYYTYEIWYVPVVFDNFTEHYHYDANGNYVGASYEGGAWVVDQYWPASAETAPLVLGF